MRSQNEEITLGPAFLWGLWIALSILLFVLNDVDMSFGEAVIVSMGVAGMGVIIFSAAPFGICRVPCDYLPKRSYPLFRSRQLLNDWLTQNQ